MSEQQKGMRELAEQFKKMEVRYDLFNKKTSDGIYYWDIFRYSVYMTILSRYEILSHGDLFLGANRDPLWKRLAKIVRMLPNYLINEFRFIFVLPRNKNPGSRMSMEILSICFSRTFMNNLRTMHSFWNISGILRLAGSKKI
jgi:hypothetical protein